MAIVENDHPMRAYVKAKLADILPHPCPINLEKGIFQYAILKTKQMGDTASWENSIYRHVYKQRFTIVFQHLENPDCSLKSRIVNKDIKSWQAASMGPYDMWPMGPYDTMKREKKIKELHKEAMIAKESEGYTGMFRCAKCKQSKTTYYQQQTRSADEPMTTFVTCMNTGCGTRWRF